MGGFGDRELAVRRKRARSEASTTEAPFDGSILLSHRAALYSMAQC